MSCIPSPTSPSASRSQRRTDVHLQEKTTSYGKEKDVCRHRELQVSTHLNNPSCSPNLSPSPLCHFPLDRFKLTDLVQAGATGSGGKAERTHPHRALELADLTVLTCESTSTGRHYHGTYTPSLADEVGLDSGAHAAHGACAVTVVVGESGSASLAMAMASS